MDEINGHSFVFRKYSAALDVTLPDCIIRIATKTSVSLSAIVVQDRECFKSFDGKILESSGMVQFCPALHTSAGTWKFRNVTTFNVPDENETIRPGARFSDDTYKAILPRYM